MAEEQSNFIPFSYRSQDVRLFVDERGNPWWVLRDVCDVLGLTNPSMAMGALDEDERAKKSLGRQGDTWIISESGLYALIIRSNKPGARPFRKWVTSEVLPALRRSGAYSILEEEDCRPLLKMARQYECIERLFRAVVGIARVAGFRGNQAVVRGNDVVRDKTGRDCLAMIGAGFLNETTSLENYVAARCSLDGEKMIRTVELYADYTEWCNRAQEPALGRNTFASELLKQAGIRKRTHGTERHWYFAGIELKEKAQWKEEPGIGEGYESEREG